MTYMFLWHDIYIIYRDIKNFDLIPTPEFEKLLEAEKNQGVFLLHHTSYFNVHHMMNVNPFERMLLSGKHFLLSWNIPWGWPSQIQVKGLSIHTFIGKMVVPLGWYP